MDLAYPQLYADLMTRMKTARPSLHRSMLISEKKRSDERERERTAGSEDVDGKDNNSSEQQ